MLRHGLELEACCVEEGFAVDIDAGPPDVGAGAVAPSPLLVVGGDEMENEAVLGDTIRELEPREVEEAEVAEGGLRIVVVGPAPERGWRLVDVELGIGNLLGPAAGADHGGVADLL